MQALVEVLTDGAAMRCAQATTDRLAEIAPRKRELLLHIAHLGEQRNRLLERGGVSADRRGMETLAARCTTPPATPAPSGSALLELTQQAALA